MCDDLTTYIKASDFELTYSNPQDVSEELQFEYAGKPLLIDLLYDRYFLINESIYQFLSLFTEPQTFSQLLAKLEIPFDNEPARTHIKQFFSDLVTREILVTTEQNERIIAYHQAEKAREICIFSDYNILECYKMQGTLWVGLVQRKTDLRKLVIKKLLLNETSPQQVIDREQKKFFQEAEILMYLNDHPAICAIYHIDKTENLIEMEYIEGQHIDRYIRDNALSLQARLALIVDLMDVFTYIEQQGITHGDIHAGNFLVDQHGTLKVIDFGLSNFVIPQDNEIIKKGGVYHYMPPESINQESMITASWKLADNYSEIYQTGIIIYLILYGHKPFTGVTWKTLSQCILTQIPVFHDKTDQHEPIDEKVIQVMQTMLAKDPKDRYKNFSQIKPIWEKIAHAAAKKL